MLALKKKENQILRLMLIQVSLIVLVSFFLAKLVTTFFWSKYLFQCHVVIELICIFISFLIFVLVWYTYENNTSVEHIICFSFLIVGIFDILHILIYSPELFICQNNLSTWYWLLGRFFPLAVGLGLFTSGFNININKYTGLFLSLFAVCFVACFFSHYFEVLPILYADGGNTKIKMLIDIVIISLYIFLLFNLRSKLTKKDVLSYNIIFSAIVLALFCKLAHSIYTETPVFNLMGHFLKIACYYFFMKGIFVSAVKYPYQKIDNHGKFLIQILDELPLGVMIYDQNIKLYFANRKVLDLLTYPQKDSFGLQQHELVQKIGQIKDLEQTGENKRILKNIYMDIRNNRGIISKVRADYYKLSHGYMIMFEELKDNQELETLKVQTRAIINSIKKILMLLDTEDKVFMYNKSSLEVLEIEEKDIIGQKIHDLFKTLQCKADDSDDKKLVKNLSQIEMVTIITPKGNKKNLRLYFEQIKNIENEVIGTLLLATDITFYKKECLKIRQREKFVTLGKMASGIVHEIKNPLTAIKGFSQLIKYKEPEGKTLEYACAIEQETDIINNFICDFLKFAKPSAPKLEQISVNNFIDSLKLVIDTNTFLSGIKVTYDLMPKVKFVMADVNQLKQVVMNIVKNAIEAIEANGGTELKISTKHHKQDKEISIKIFNDGKAMSEEDKLLVGTPFFTTKQNGTGLGLSICFQLIKEHNGRIEIESEEGRGTSFTIYLPIAP